MLMLPVGGFYTIDPAQATAVMESVKPAVTIPCISKHPSAIFPSRPSMNSQKVKRVSPRVKASEIEAAKGSLPKEPSIFVLQYAL